VKTLYISGGITGIPDFTERFDLAKKIVADRGDSPVSPLDVKPFCISQYHGDPEPSCEEWPGNPRSNGHTWGCWLRGDLIEMLRCDGIITLPGWERSSGAQLEVVTGLRVGLTLEHLTEDDLLTFGRA
jgi:hypothetical protein